MFNIQRTHPWHWLLLQLNKWPRMHRVSAPSNNLRKKGDLSQSTQPGWNKTSIWIQMPLCWSSPSKWESWDSRHLRLWTRSGLSCTWSLLRLSIWCTFNEVSIAQCLIFSACPTIARILTAGTRKLNHHGFTEALSLKSLQVWSLLEYLALLFYGRHVAEVVNIFLVSTKEPNAQVLFFFSCNIFVLL